MLHIGCVDAGLMEEQFKKNELLHQKLDEVTTLLYGVDIDMDGISFLQEKGFNNLFFVDICDEGQCKVLYGLDFDVIILSEVIEHLMNPGLMLESIKKLMNEKTELLVSVPNAFNATNILNMLKGIEFVHPDHNYYFSYVCLNNLLKKSDLTIKKNYVYSFSEYAPFKSEYSTIKLIYWNLAKKYKAASGWLQFSKIISGDFLYWLTHFFEIRFVKFLYSKTVFFGDGLFVCCMCITVK
ncbi:protein of unknown function [Methylotuvimicrobium alcaliphilum 20Z]|uniref:Methyltransferase type 11 n=1 Tax=Methylotuvimicrobium alcaliphilum (strain DSM 19304 / NCIMB 14124 / VKM B-2133 / 20Z) TaxID=1091494 RepID=G4SYT8_META2|nr:protein of unknown function [Methylotuvimicrobium alcaliphilum 20Z]